MKDIYIIGSGGFGRETAETIRDMNKITPAFNIKGFIDDDESKWGHIYNDIEVLGGTSYLAHICRNNKPYSVISIADGNVKARMAEKFHGLVEWANIIHPTVVKWSNVDMGVGNVFQPFVFIGPNAKIGNHTMANVKTNIGHDTIIEDYSSFMCFCDITGNVHVQKKVFAGSRVSIIPGLSIGESAKLGAGSVIIKDVEPGVTMHGYMAKDASLNR
jgi:sugar O-acyltransferase (sialic acid O-acetyltransferase NeuD family)